MLPSNFYFSVLYTSSKKGRDTDGRFSWMGWFAHKYAVCSVLQEFVLELPVSARQGEACDAIVASAGNLDLEQVSTTPFASMQTDVLTDLWWRYHDHDASRCLSQQYYAD
jgi:hypothetical protein